MSTTDTEKKNKVIEDLQRKVKDLEGKSGDFADSIIGKFIED